MNFFYITLTIIFLIIEVFLLALTYLDKKRVDWKVNRIKESPAIKNGWLRFLFIFIFSALLLAFLLPANYQPLPMDRINSFLSQELALTERPEMEPGENLPQNLESTELPDEAAEERKKEKQKNEPKRVKRLKKY